MKLQESKNPAKDQFKNPMKLGRSKLPPKQIYLNKFITKEVLSQWFLCFSNFILPLLVLLEDPQIFLVMIAIYLTLGFCITIKGPRRSINEIMLSVYPLLFHFCFMKIFYWAPWPIVILYTQLICFSVLILGLVHNMLVMAVGICVFVYRVIRFNMRSNKIQPQINDKVIDIPYHDRNLERPCKTMKKQQIVNLMENESAIGLKQRNNKKISIPLKNHFLSPDNSNIIQIKQKRQHDIIEPDEHPTQNSSLLQMGNTVAVKKVRAEQIIDGLVVVTKEKIKRKSGFHSNDCNQI